jgi:hypothetical protein
MKLSVLTLLAALAVTSAKAQNSAADSTETERAILDSLYILEVEEVREPAKLLHAEPLYIDLIRDLGARKGEKEWNVGLGLIDNNSYDKYEALVEYEFAPVDRLGLEIELPFSFYYPTAGNGEAPGSKLNSLKLAAQWTFLVSEPWKTSMALGYIHEFEFTEFSKYGVERFYAGNIFNPFYVAARRFGRNFHVLLYTGPQFLQHFAENTVYTDWQINTNFHYMISGTRNFVGVEFNKELRPGDFDMTIRPQMRVGIAENLLVGIVSGIPIDRENQRFSSFVRLIYEPGHKNGKHKH